MSVRIEESAKWISKKPIAIATGVGLSAAIPWAAYLIGHKLSTSLPTIPYQHPGKAVIDLGQEANRGVFEYIMSGSLWAMHLGPVFVFCVLISLKTFSIEAVMKSLTATSIYCAAILLIAFGQFFWTHAFGPSWLLSPPSLISYNGDTPTAVVNYKLAMSMSSGCLLFGSFFLGLLLTNSWLKKELNLPSRSEKVDGSTNALKIIGKRKN